MRTLFCLIVLCAPLGASAQDTEASPPAERAAPPEATDVEAGADTDGPDTDGAPEASGTGAAATEADAAAAGTGETTTTAPETARSALAPKVAIVVSGDPDPLLQAAALEIEARLALAAELRLPADAALRATLRGEAGTPNDGLDEVRRERSRLGLGEATDAPVLSRLGRRAGAVLVIIVHDVGAGPEAIALDVRSGQFFEGSLSLVEPAPDAIAPFVARRARIAARGSATAEIALAEDSPDVAPEQAVEAVEGQDAGAWFEQNWPYFAAGGLLAAAIAFVVVTATDGGDPPPMLRFQPGVP